MIVQSASQDNVLTKERLEEAMSMHDVIESRAIVVDDESYDFLDLCVQAGGTCVSGFGGVCSCLVSSILKQWNYDINMLRNDTDVLATLNKFGSKEDLDAF